MSRVCVLSWSLGYSEGVSVRVRVRVRIRVLGLGLEGLCYVMGQFPF